MQEQNILIPSGGLVFRTPFFLMRGKVPLALMTRAEKKPGSTMGPEAFWPLYYATLQIQLEFLF